MTQSVKYPHSHLRVAMNEHRHTYWVYWPRDFGNEYTVIAVPQHHVPAYKTTTWDGDTRTEKLTPQQGTLERVTRDEALHLAAATSSEAEPRMHVHVSMCPYCEDDALQSEASRKSDHGALAGRVKKAREDKRMGHPSDQPASIPK